MKNKLNLIISIISGIVLTIILGFVSYPPGDLIGTQKWGYPIYWLSQVVYPSAPVEVFWLNLFFDCAIWIICFFLLIKLINFLITRYKK